MKPPATQDALPLDVPEPRSATAVEFATRVENETTRYDLLSSPMGTLLLVGDGEALTGLHMGVDDGYTPENDGVSGWRRDPEAFRDTVEQLRAYFAGELREFDVRLAPAGSTFQLRVWRALTTIPYGQTASYGDIAKAVGYPNGSRAVGMANNRNPISVIVPCHRVIGANGALVGYGGGLERKEHLLRLERSGRL